MQRAIKVTSIVVTGCSCIEMIATADAKWDLGKF